jgi:flagella basal body P-ring formation protein FlgA
MLRVKVLQEGKLGEVVRVRVAGNGHTLLARVAGPDTVEAEF